MANRTLNPYIAGPNRSVSYLAKSDKHQSSNNPLGTASDYSKNALTLLILIVGLYYPDPQGTDSGPSPTTETTAAASLLCLFAQ